MSGGLDNLREARRIRRAAEQLEKDAERAEKAGNPKRAAELYERAWRHRRSAAQLDGGSESPEGAA